MIICLLSILSLPLQTSSTLKLATISDTRAVCNDHSRAKYYTDHETQRSNKWIIYLESGGGCSTEERCKERFSSSQILMSSGWLDDHTEIEGHDILSTDVKNYFHDYNHVYLPYCSSDMYVGMNVPDGSAFNKEEGNFLFAGYYIVQGLITDLSDISGAQFTEVTLAGSSAGGIGVINHIKIIKEKLAEKHSNVNVRGIVDSSWFINFEDNFLQLWDSDSAQTLTDYESFPHYGEGSPGECSKLSLIHI